MDAIQVITILSPVAAAIAVIRSGRKDAQDEGKWRGTMESTVSSTSSTATETKTAVHALTDLVNSKLNRFDYILSGPDGGNGLQGDMKIVKGKVETLERAELERRVATKPRRKSSQGTDRRRKAS